GQPVNRAFEAVEDVTLACRDDLERLVIVSAAYLTCCHEDSVSARCRLVASPSSRDKRPELRWGEWRRSGLGMNLRRVCPKSKVFMRSSANTAVAAISGSH